MNSAEIRPYSIRKSVLTKTAWLTLLTLLAQLVFPAVASAAPVAPASQAVSISSDARARQTDIKVVEKATPKQLSTRLPSDSAAQGNHLPDIDHSKKPANSQPQSSTKDGAAVVSPHRLTAQAPKSVKAGQDLTVTYDWSLGGQDLSAPVEIELAVPQGLTPVAISSDGKYSPSTGLVRWTLARPLSTKQGRVSIRLTVDRSFDNGTVLSLTAKLQSKNSKPVSATAKTNVQSETNVALDILSARQIVTPGDDLPMTIAWTNSGSAPLRQAVLILRPSDLATVRADDESRPIADDSGLSWQLGDIPAGASGSVSIRVQTISPLPNSSKIIIAAELNGQDGGCPRQASARNELTVNSDFLLKAELTAPASTSTNNTFAYNVNWSIEGNELPGNVSLVLQIDPRLTIEQLTESPVVNQNIINWSLEPAAPGTKHTESVIVHTADTMPASFSAVGQICGATGETQTCVALTAETTITNEPTIALVKTASRSSIVPGEPISYSLTWSVGGTGEATNLILSDPIPDHLAWATISADGEYDPATRTLRWDLGDRTSGESGVVTWTSTADSPLADGLEIVNTATLTADDLAPVSATARSTVDSHTKLKLTKSANQSEAVPGSEITYTLDWSATGDNPLTDVTLTDPLPDGLTFVSASAGGTYKTKTRTVRWRIGDVFPNDHGRVTVTVRIDPTVPLLSIIKNEAQITATGAQPAAATSRITANGTPILKINKRATQRTAQPGDSVDYVVVISNSGTLTAQDVVINDVLPKGFIFIDTGQRERSFVIGDLKPETSKTITYSAVIASQTTAGTYTNKATAEATNHRSISDTAAVRILSAQTTQVERSPRLRLAKTVDRSTIPAGGVLTYTVTVSNDGTAPALNIRLTDSLPTGLSFLDRSGSSSTWHIGDLLPNHERIITYQARVSLTANAGQATNQVTAQSDNAPSINAQASTLIKKGQVLGALSTTGAGMIDAGLALLGASSALAGWLLWRRRGKKVTSN